MICRQPLGLVVLATLVSSSTLAQGWWDTRWPYRVAVQVGGNGYQRFDAPAEVELDFTALLAAAGSSAQVDPDSVRVIHAGSGDYAAFQFDPAADFDPATRARGTVIVMSTLGASEEKWYHVYFGPPGGAYGTFFIAPDVIVTDNVTDEGQDCFQIYTSYATYYFQKEAAGFSSLHDTDGTDWINYHPIPDNSASGSYRGIPNLGDWGHPGYTGSYGSASELVSDGPFKATIRSTHTGGWSKRWEFFPRFARMTMESAAGDYWFLYEGTPGGVLEVDGNDYCVRSPGVETPITTSWHEDLPGPEWVYFGDRAAGRSIYLAHLDDDAHSDQFWQMNSAMTVFGFGRQFQCCDMYMNTAPNRFVIGLAYTIEQVNVVGTIADVTRPLAIAVEGVERREVVTDGGVYDQASIPDVSVGPDLALTDVPGMDDHEQPDPAGVDTGAADVVVFEDIHAVADVIVAADLTEPADPGSAVTDVVAAADRSPSPDRPSSDLGSEDRGGSGDLVHAVDRAFTVDTGRPETGSGAPERPVTGRDGTVSTRLGDGCTCAQRSDGRGLFPWAVLLVMGWRRR